VAVIVPAEFGVQEVLVKADPDRYFVPPYVGGQGWIGIRIDRSPDWAAVEGLVKDAYGIVTSSPKRPRRAAPRTTRR
jgi:hypothetical protein